MIKEFIILEEKYEGCWEYLFLICGINHVCAYENRENLFSIIVGMNVLLVLWKPVSVQCFCVVLNLCLPCVPCDGDTMYPSMGKLLFSLVWK